MQLDRRELLIASAFAGLSLVGVGSGVGAAAQADEDLSTEPARLALLGKLTGAARHTFVEDPSENRAEQIRAAAPLLKTYQNALAKALQPGAPNQNELSPVSINEIEAAVDAGITALNFTYFTESVPASAVPEGMAFIGDVTRLYDTCLEHLQRLSPADVKEQERIESIRERIYGDLKYSRNHNSPVLDRQTADVIASRLLNDKVPAATKRERLLLFLPHSTVQEVSFSLHLLRAGWCAFDEFFKDHTAHSLEPFTDLGTLDGQLLQKQLAFAVRMNQLVAAAHRTAGVSALEAAALKRWQQEDLAPSVAAELTALSHRVKANLELGFSHPRANRNERIFGAADFLFSINSTVSQLCDGDFFAPEEADRMRACIVSNINHPMCIALRDLHKSFDTERIATDGQIDQVVTNVAIVASLIGNVDGIVREAERRDIFSQSQAAEIFLSFDSNVMPRLVEHLTHVGADYQKLLRGFSTQPHLARVQEYGSAMAPTAILLQSLDFTTSTRWCSKERADAYRKVVVESFTQPLVNQWVEMHAALSPEPDVESELSKVYELLGSAPPIGTITLTRALPYVEPAQVERTFEGLRRDILQALSKDPEKAALLLTAVGNIGWPDKIAPRVRALLVEVLAADVHDKVHVLQCGVVPCLAAFILGSAAGPEADGRFIPHFRRDQIARLHQEVVTLGDAIDSEDTELTTDTPSAFVHQLFGVAVRGDIPESWNSAMIASEPDDLAAPQSVDKLAEHIRQLNKSGTSGLREDRELELKTSALREHRERELRTSALHAAAYLLGDFCRVNENCSLVAEYQIGTNCTPPIFPRTWMRARTDATSTDMRFYYEAWQKLATLSTQLLSKGTELRKPNLAGMRVSEASEAFLSLHSIANRTLPSQKEMRGDGSVMGVQLSKLNGSRENAGPFSNRYYNLIDMWTCARVGVFPEQLSVLGESIHQEATELSRLEGTRIALGIAIFSFDTLMAEVQADTSKEQSSKSKSPRADRRASQLALDVLNQSGYFNEARGSAGDALRDPSTPNYRARLVSLRDEAQVAQRKILDRFLTDVEDAGVTLSRQNGSTSIPLKRAALLDPIRPEGHRITIANRAPLYGTIKGLSGGLLTIEDQAGSTYTLATAEVVEISLPRLAPKASQPHNQRLFLDDGSVHDGDGLVGSPDGKTLRFQRGSGQEVEFPFQGLDAVLFKPLSKEAQVEWDAILRRRILPDIVLIETANGLDTVEGKIVAIREDAETHETQVEVSLSVGGEFINRTLPLNRFVGIMFGTSNQIKQKAKTICAISDRFGRQTASSIEIHNGEVRFTTPIGATRTIPLAEVHEIDFSPESSATLASITPMRVTWNPFPLRAAFTPDKSKTPSDELYEIVLSRLQNPCRLFSHSSEAGAENEEGPLVLHPGMQFAYRTPSLNGRDASALDISVRLTGRDLGGDSAILFRVWGRSSSKGPATLLGEAYLRSVSEDLHLQCNMTGSPFLLLEAVSLGSDSVGCSAEVTGLFLQK